MELLCAFPPLTLASSQLIKMIDRLENEHLGNMDQYRVTREVPLPYTFDDAAHESDGDEDDHKSVSSWRGKRKAPSAKMQATDLSSDGQTEVDAGIHN